MNWTAEVKQRNRPMDLAAVIQRNSKEDKAEVMRRSGDEDESGKRQGNHVEGKFVEMQRQNQVD